MSSQYGREGGGGGRAWAACREQPARPPTAGRARLTRATRGRYVFSGLSEFAVGFGVNRMFLQSGGMRVVESTGELGERPVGQAGAAGYTAGAHQPLSQHRVHRKRILPGAGRLCLAAGRAPRATDSRHAQPAADPSASAFSHQGKPASLFFFLRNLHAANQPLPCFHPHQARVASMFRSLAVELDGDGPSSVTSSVDISDLPFEISICILRHLPGEDLAAACAASAVWAITHVMARVASSHHDHEGLQLLIFEGCRAASARR